MTPKSEYARPSNAWACALLALLGILFAVYAPGLSGGFLLDDLINLNRLGNFGGVDNWETAATYLFGGHLQGIGRPISLASFLIDDFAWPSDPRGFLYTNILFHLLTTTLVAALALQLARALSFSPEREAAVCVLTAALWGLHPFFVSTVLYIVQRMTILAALFVICGLALYVFGRRRLSQGVARDGYLYMTLAIVVFTPLAVLSKPNGALLPLLVLVLEGTLLARLGIGPSSRRLWTAWRGLFLLLPLVLMAAYFAVTWRETITLGYVREDLTLKERLLTEPRILFDYVANLLAPRIQTSGLLHDAYHANSSSGLLSPATTLASLIGLLGALGLAFWLRRRRPVLAAGILFFLAAHLIESSFIPLELYFEHRNYLPTVIPAFAAAVGLTALQPRQATLASVTIVLLLGGFTAMRASLWGKPDELLLTWASKSPDSIRAAQYSALVYVEKGRPDKALDSIDRVLERHPDNPNLHVQRVILLCIANELEPRDADQALNVLREQYITDYTVQNLTELGEHIQRGCDGFDTRALADFVGRLLKDSKVQRPAKFYEDIGYLHGRLMLRTGEIDAAAKSFRLAAAATESLPATMQMTVQLAAAGAHDHALCMLNLAEKYLDKLQHGGGGMKQARNQLAGAAIDYRAEIARLRQHIRETRDNARSPQ